MSIKPLSKETIKLINSTQVISSIYSAVKELVENSLDANAQNIEVNLVDDGLSLIQVKDNGIGISREDAPYMALPSYTSKISDFNDLDLLSTYGFRGEGLTSICQVADVTISTKTINDETMICYTLDHEGNVINSELSHGVTGTTVQLKDLFKKMPVRRNILSNKKRINQEIKAVEILLKTYAICKPSVKLTFRVNSNIIFSKPNCKTVHEAIKLVLGAQTFSNLIHIKKKLSEAEVELFIPSKDLKKFDDVVQAGYQFLCVNGRPVKAKEIEKKIIKRIMEHFNLSGSSSKKFVYCLILEVDSKQLDVNLEPNKDKIFLQNEDEIQSEIDNLILSFYELQDSQISMQNDIENLNVNGNIENENKEPAIKKRKVDLKEDTDLDRNALKEKKSTVTLMQQDFLSNIRNPELSDSDSDADKSNEKKNRLINEIAKLVDNDSPESAVFDLPAPTKIIEETLSQLPKVDLGEDFNWEEIMNKNVSTHEKKAEMTDKLQTSDLAWSKGQVPGLQSGIAVGLQNEHESELFDFNKNVEQINDSEEQISNDLFTTKIQEFDWKIDLKNTKNKTPTKTTEEKRQKKSLNVDPNQTKIPFAGDNACLSYTGPSAFSMYCLETRAKIVQENPEFTPAEVASELNKKWKELSSDNRQYYRDLAKENEMLRESKSPMILPSKKSKSQISDSEKDKNRKKLINLLQNMKVSRAELKDKSVIMRTFVSWDMNMKLLTEKFQNPTVKKKESVVGSLNSLLWVINLNSNLFVFDITELHAQLKITDYDVTQINHKYVQNITEKWIKEKRNMDIFHPLPPVS